ncbi:MAG: 5-oxoprolinase subunit PxpB [Rhodomicrobium sp.]|nr:5-oxoprolinase subunit PxpB [Rhodomicrobium sp.]
MRLHPAFFDCAESALLVDFGLEHSKALSLAILDLSERLERAGLAGVRESVPALSSLTVFYDALELPGERLAAEIEALCKMEPDARAHGKAWEIPVVYGGEAGPDLKEAAARAGLTEDEALRLHAAQLYHVYMLGFLPGFAYLGDLPEPLRLPRRATPRARVPAGSVAIAADMTAIYPLESPGGWHLIGFTPVVLWDMARRQEPLLKPGDRVRFVAISEAEAEELRQHAADGWVPEPVEAE